MRNFFLAMVILTTATACSPLVDAYSNPYYVNATWYQCCRYTASGERFNPNGATAAHRTYPFGTMLRVTNPDNNRSIVVRVNDRGPFTKGVDLDISRGGAQELGILLQGRAKVRVEQLLTSR